MTAAKANIPLRSDSASSETYIPHKTPLNQAIVRDLLDYNPLTGDLHWKVRPRKYSRSETAHEAINNRIAGMQAFTALNSGGYYQGAIIGNHSTAHRVIWLWMTGEWPDDCIDHIDRNQTNNRWANLRLCTRSQNQANRKPYANSSSQYHGVMRLARKKKDTWQAVITKDYKAIDLGVHKTEIAAALAYDAAAKIIHGDFANLNFPGGLIP